ncbi:MAG: hypothetical protein ACLQGV_15285 [Bryobacteraceae bacterium]
MNVASLPSFLGPVPAAAPARSPAPASASGGQAAAEFPGLIAALLAAMPAELEAAADPTASGSGGKSKTNPGVQAKTTKAAKKPPAVSSGPVVPSSSPAAAPPKPAQPASGDGKKAPTKAAPSDTAEAASEPGSPTVPAAASGDAKDTGTNLAQVPASAPAAAPAAVAPIALPAVASAASPADPKGSPDRLRTEQISVPAAAASPAPSRAVPTAIPAQPQPAAPDASRSTGSDAARPPAALPATAPDEDLPSPGKPAAAKTELAFAARLTEQSSGSAASDGSSPAASAAKNDAAAIPVPPPAAEGASTTPSLAAPSIRLASSKEPEKASPESSSGVLEPAGARADTTVPAGSGPLLRSTAQPATAAKDIAPAAPLDVEPARAQLGPQPVRQLSIVIPQTASDGVTPEPVEVRLLDSGGQLHVAVRSADPSLNQSLGNQLGDLVTQLEHSGYRTETWRPVVSAAVVGGVSAVSGTSAQQLRGGTDQQGSSGSGRGNQGGDAEDSSKRQRRDQDKTAPQWLDLLEESGSPQTNSERISLHGNVSA